MYLQNVLPAKRIKDIAIDNLFIKIKDSDNTKKEFLIESLGKVFLKSRSQNRYLLYFLTFVILVALFGYFVSSILAVSFFIILIIFLYISKFSLIQKIFFLHIQNKSENSDYAISFKSNRKQEMLDVIWEIRKRQFKLNE